MARCVTGRMIGIWFFASMLLTAGGLAAHGQVAADESSAPSAVQSASTPSQNSGQSSTLPFPPPSQGGDLLLKKQDVDRNIWANAKTYVDLPVQEIQRKVEELQGLEPEASQEGLTSLLDRVGRSSVDLLHHTPNVASHEEQITDQHTVSLISQGDVQPIMAPHVRDRQEFGYLLLSHATGTGMELKEYRTDKGGRPLGNSRSRNGQMSEGFASEWLRLLPGNQHESRFRYLGRQEVDKRKTLVLAFAQIPEEVKYPAQFVFAGVQADILLQGVVWVDASDFRIVRIREDMLAPRPDVQLKEVTTRIRFSEVSLEKAGMSLWLPVEAAISWNCKGMAVAQRHIYSDYRLYAVKTRIIPQ